MIILEKILLLISHFPPLAYVRSLQLGSNMETNITSEQVNTSGTYEPTTMEENIEYEWLDITYYTIRHIQSVFGIVGNVLVLVSVATFANLQNANSVLITSLAVADILANLSAPLAATVTFLFWMNDRNSWLHLCYVKDFLVLEGTYMNVVTIFLIALDRFSSVTFPFKYLAMISKPLI